jgi:hypothetical protein
MWLSTFQLFLLSRLITLVMISSNERPVNNFPLFEDIINRAWIYTGCFFYFGLFDMLIICSFFEQKLSSWTFFISTFCSYFAKKNLGKKFLNSKFYSSFCKSDDFLEIMEKILFLKFSKNIKFQIFTNLDPKSKFFDSFC